MLAKFSNSFIGNDLGDQVRVVVSRGSRQFAILSRLPVTT